MSWQIGWRRRRLSAFWLSEMEGGDIGANEAGSETGRATASGVWLRGCSRRAGFASNDLEHNGGEHESAGLFLELVE